jgi:hypothetical protein
MNIVFFVGNDITSHLIVESAIPFLAKNGHRMHIALTRQIMRTEMPSDLAELYFFERTLLEECVYPFLETRPALQAGQPAKIRSFAMLARSYGNVTIANIDDVNDPVVIAYLRRHGITVGVSVRCYQKFGLDIIRYFQSASGGTRSVLLNLHPGLLPQYRGVFTFAHAMNRAEAVAGFTLHHINEQWDAGPIVDAIARPLDYSSSVLENMCSLYPLARGLVTAAIGNLTTSVRLRSRGQQEDSARYFTHLTTCELQELRSKGILLVDGEKIVELLVDAFTTSNGSERSELWEVLRAAMRGR